MTVAEAVAPPRSEDPPLALADDLRLLAALHDREPTAEFLAVLAKTPVEALFDLPLADRDGEEALDFLERALRLVATTPGAAIDLAADHAAIYLTHGYKVAPSESPWIDPEGLFAQAPMFEVRDWYRHWGVEVPNWRSRPDDHLVTQLSFVAHLLDRRDDPIAAADAARFLDVHLLRWIGTFADGVVRRCREPYWAAVARLTQVYLEALREKLVETTGVARAVLEPIEAVKERLRDGAQEKGETCASPAYVPGIAPSW